MATQFYGVPFQDGKVDKNVVLTGTVTTAQVLELSFDLASNFGATVGRNDVLQALESIKVKILAGNWPPP